MAGRPRLPIGAFGDVKTNQVGPGRFRAYARFRDWDGETRQVSATGASRGAAKSALKERLATRMRLGGGDTLTGDSPFTKLADAWIEDVRRDVDRSDGTKETYARELRTLIVPYFEHFTVREVTVSRVDRYLKDQRDKSFARAKHSRTLLGMILAFAVRQEIIQRNPVKEASRMKAPKHTLTDARTMISETADIVDNWRELASRNGISRGELARFEDSFSSGIQTLRDA